MIIRYLSLVAATALALSAPARGAEVKVEQRLWKARQ